MNTDAILECRDIHKAYRDGERNIPVLSGVHFKVMSGERVAIVGKSGSGKTTLMNHLGGLECPSQGEVFFDGINIHNITDERRGFLRNRLFGFIFQFHHLLPEFTALENVAMPLLIRNASIRETKELSAQALDKVGLKARMSHKPSQLSGGERQRVAVARALVTKPKCVLADEPTGNLDQESAAQVYELMMGLTAQVGTSFVVVTHDYDLAERMDRIVKLDHGQIHPFE